MGMGRVDPEVIAKLRAVKDNRIQENVDQWNSHIDTQINEARSAYATSVGSEAPGVDDCKIRKDNDCLHFQRDLGGPGQKRKLTE